MRINSNWPARSPHQHHDSNKTQNVLIKTHTTPLTPNPPPLLMSDHPHETSRSDQVSPREICLYTRFRMREHHPTTRDVFQRPPARKQRENELCQSRHFGLLFGQAGVPSLGDFVLLSLFEIVREKNLSPGQHDFSPQTWCLTRTTRSLPSQFLQGH